MRRDKVTESATVLNTKVQGSWVLAPIVGSGEGMEPIGQRIIEVPDDPGTYRRTITHLLKTRRL